MSNNRGQNKSSNLPIVTEYTYGAANIITDIQGIFWLHNPTNYGTVG